MWWGMKRKNFQRSLCGRDARLSASRHCLLFFNNSTSRTEKGLSSYDSPKFIHYPKAYQLHPHLHTRGSGVETNDIMRRGWPVLHFWPFILFFSRLRNVAVPAFQIPNQKHWIVSDPSGMASLSMTSIMSVPKDPDNGYPALSKVMVYPGMSIFQRYAELNNRNLLYMQAEILDLERELHMLAGRDSVWTQDSDKQFAISASSLRESERGGNKAQWGLVLKIREKLKEYSTYQVACTKCWADDLWWCFTSTSRGSKAISRP